MSVGEPLSIREETIRITLYPLAASRLHWRAGSLSSFTAIRKDAGLFFGSFLRQGEVFATPMVGGTKPYRTSRFSGMKRVWWVEMCGGLTRMWWADALFFFLVCHMGIRGLISHELSHLIPFWAFIQPGDWCACERDPIWTDSNARLRTTL